VHGGQRRAGAILDGYCGHGIHARYLPFYVAASYPDTSDAEGIVASQSVLEAIARQPILEDVILGDLLDRDAACCRRFLKAYEAVRPDVLQLEQPYLWPAVKRLRESGRLPRIPVIYSSQNVETLMKEKIYERSLAADEWKAATQRVRALEEDLVRQAALVIAVTDSDARELEGMGARQCLVVPNGHDPLAPSSAALARWKSTLLGGWRRAYAFFVSSHHLPNFWGFDEMVGPVLGYVPPDAEIVVAGGIAQLLYQHENYGPSSTLNSGRIHLLLGKISDDDMAAILHLARVVLLPITHGGGSNLKTVEALFSGRPIVATRYAFRGYEEYASVPRVQLCDSRTEFHDAVQRLLLQPPDENAPGAPADDEQLKRLTWPELTKALASQVAAIVS
jgi:glycosyltransferase involved in cell wall biosynthesis